MRWGWSNPKNSLANFALKSAKLGLDAAAIGFPVGRSVRVARTVTNVRRAKTVAKAVKRSCTASAKKCASAIGYGVLGVQSVHSDAKDWKAAASRLKRRTTYYGKAAKSEVSRTVSLNRRRLTVPRSWFPW